MFESVVGVYINFDIVFVVRWLNKTHTSFRLLLWTRARILIFDTHNHTSNNWFWLKVLSFPFSKWNNYALRPQIPLYSMAGKHTKLYLKRWTEKKEWKQKVYTQIKWKYTQRLNYRLNSNIYSWGTHMWYSVWIRLLWLGFFSVFSTLFCFPLLLPLQFNACCVLLLLCHVCVFLQRAFIRLHNGFRIGPIPKTPLTSLIN